MDLELISQIAGALGLILAVTVLALSVQQLRLLERSIKGNTYQLMAEHALEIQKVLLQNPRIDYLYADDGPDRDQEIFNNILGNYIESLWIQQSHGLFDDEAWPAFEGLLRKYARQHREVFEVIATGENYAPGLRRYSATLLGGIDAEIRLNQ